MKKKQTLESLITSCTENACIAVQLMASYSLPYRFYTDFLLSIDLMLSKISSAYIHPVGNINHSLNAIKPINSLPLSFQRRKKKRICIS